MGEMSGFFVSQGDWKEPQSGIEWRKRGIISDLWEAGNMISGYTANLRGKTMSICPGAAIYLKSKAVLEFIWPA